MVIPTGWPISCTFVQRLELVQYGGTETVLFRIALPIPGDIIFHDRGPLLRAAIIELGGGIRNSTRNWSPKTNGTSATW